MSANRLRELMQNLYDAHREFKKAFQDSIANWKGKEPLEVSSSRDKFWDALILLFGEIIEPLHDAFLADKITVLDDVIDFLAIDIPAFRCGYEKEWYLRRLKSLPLSEAQKARLKTIALDLSRKPDYRREFYDWAKLMIVLADKPFVDELETLLESSDEFVQKKVKRMLTVILENRKDLRRKKLVSS